MAVGVSVEVLEKRPLLAANEQGLNDDMRKEPP
jgi:hypothetical protein